MTVARFGLIGAGWRSAFFLRVAAALPERFEATGLLTRDPGRRAAFAGEFGVATPESLDDLLASKPDFVVVATPRLVTPDFLRALTDRHVPVLSETPPAPDLDGLRALDPARPERTGIQVAEQSQFGSRFTRLG